MKPMKQALNLAIRAGQHGDVPVGAIIVQNSKVIARGENFVQRKKNPTLHAEIVAINRACKKLGEKFLTDCDIYVTLEPCAMCAIAISFARIKNIYFAATDDKGGGITTNARIFDNDKHLWKPNITQMPEYAAESAELLRNFFSERRKKADN